MGRSWKEQKIKGIDCKRDDRWRESRRKEKREDSEFPKDEEYQDTKRKFNRDFED